MKLGRTVHDRADVRIGRFDLRAAAMFGKEVKNGPGERTQEVSSVKESKVTISYLSKLIVPVTNEKRASQVARGLE